MARYSGFDIDSFPDTDALEDQRRGRRDSLFDLGPRPWWASETDDEHEEVSE